jgi:hypothetical protein
VTPLPAGGDLPDFQAITEKKIFIPWNLAPELGA